jgi:polyhydroxybutyrate depolymerase
MSQRVACDLGADIRAIAPVAGSLSEELAEVCEPGGPVAVMLFLGTADHLVPYEGGDLGGAWTGRTFGTLKSAQDTASFWATTSECSAEPESQTFDAADDETSVEMTRFGDCAGRTEVILYSIDGGGHTWPGARWVPGLGTVSAELDASLEMWRFFREVARDE